MKCFSGSPRFLTSWNYVPFFKKKCFHLALLLSVLLISRTGFCEGADNAKFRDMPLSDFSLSVGRILGKTIVISSPLKGHVTLDSSELNNGDWHELLLSVLRSYGYSVIETAKTITVVEASKATSGFGYLTDSGSGSVNEIITHAVPLAHAQVNDVSTSISKTLGDTHDVVISAVTTSNMLIITGFRDMVNKVVRLALSADAIDDTQTVTVPLEFASAKPLASEIKELIHSSNQKNSIDITADIRSNSLVIQATSNDLAKMKSLITQLDTPEASESIDDNEGNVVYLKYAQAKDVAEILQKIIGADKESLSSVVAAEKVNAVIINAYGDEQQILRDLVKHLDIRRAQVHVEAMIVEVADAEGINFGVQWGSSDGSIVQFSNGTQLPLGALAGALHQARPDKGSTVIDENGNTTVNPDSKGDLSTLLGLLAGYNGAAVSVVKGDWMALVQAMKSNSSANILSTPSLTTLDNQKASFMVGEEVPVITGSTTSANNTNPFQTVDRRNVGTRLTIQPQINSGNAVQLQLSAEVSKVEGNTGVDVVFAERKLDTTVLVDNGSMIVLGGLIDEQEDDNHASIPLLGDIPVLGRLFSADSHTKQKRNLMIFIRPTILRTEGDVEDMSSEKYRYIHDRDVFHDVFHSFPSSSQVTSDGKGDEVSAFRRVNPYD
ncbi:type II secretion system protein GspD [Salmonella enterica]